MDSIKDVLIKVVGDLQSKSENDPVKLAWDAVVEKNIKQHARPIGIKRKILRIIVDSSAMMYNMGLYKKSLLKKFQDKGLKIEDIRFFVGNVS